jgi:hypothetical protein
LHVVALAGIRRCKPAHGLYVRRVALDDSGCRKPTYSDMGVIDQVLPNAGQRSLRYNPQGLQMQRISDARTKQDRGRADRPCGQRYPIARDALGAMAADNLDADRRPFSMITRSTSVFDRIVRFSRPRAGWR